MDNESPAEGGGDRPSRLFSSSAGEGRVRRAGDAGLVIIGLLTVVASGYLARRSLRIQDTIMDVVEALPGWARDIFALAFGLAAVFAIWLLIAAVVSHPPRWDIASDIFFAAIAAVGVALVLARMVDGAWPVVVPELGRAEAVPRYPVVRVVAITAMVTAAAPHVVRPVRRLGWAFVAIGAISGLGIGLGIPVDALGGIGVGLAVASALFLIIGAPAGYPDAPRVAADLAQLGLSIGGLTPSARQSWGARTLLGEDASGASYLVKVYGRDARDAQLLAKFWRFLWYRDAGPSLSMSRLQQVEHEALVTLLAARAGLNVPDVVAAAISGDDDAVLITENVGDPLDALDPPSIPEGLLVQFWEQVGRLHAADIAHGSLNTAAVRVDDGSVYVTGFDTGSLSASPDRLAVDVAEALFSLADLAGVERAVSTAQAGLQDEALQAAIPYLQLAAIGPRTRRLVEEPKDLMASLRDAVVAATGAEVPDPAKLRRVTPRDLVFTGLMVLAGYFLIHQLAGLDLEEIWQTLRSAEWGWAIAGFIAAQLILLPNATGMIAAVSAPIPLRPTIVLQSAIQFIGLAVPSAAGRIATNVAYLRRYGVGSVTAITQGALDSFTGFLVQAAILVSALAFGDLSFGLGGDFDVNWSLILAIAIGVIVVSGLVVYFVEPLRQRIFSVLGEAFGALRGLFQEPRRAIALFSSNFASQLALAATLWLMARAYGAPISLVTALFIVVGAVLLGGVAPTPGGIGVQEAVLAAGMVSAGVSQDVAFAIAIAYRLVTFFLPPIWGLFSLKWLEKHEYL